MEDKEAIYDEQIAPLMAQLLEVSPVIAWLENGCDPKEAAKELRIHQQRMRSND